MDRVDNDGHRSAVLATLAEALAGPLAAGAQIEPVTVNARGQFRLPAGIREPLLLIAPAAEVDGEPLVVTAATTGGNLAPVTFAPWTEAHAFMPLHRPAVGAAGTTLADSSYALRVRLAGRNVQPLMIRGLIEVQILSGSFGRLFYLLHAETVRIRRLMRQVAHARLLSAPEGAEGAMLDRIGRELAVPRFGDRISVAGGQIVTEEAREEDSAYRRRLGIYRPFLMSTRAQVEKVLNRGSDARRFKILEDDNRFHVALRLVSVAADADAAATSRRNYQRYLRETVLIDPTVAVPAGRMMPSARRREERLLRQRLQGFLDFAGPSRSMAPALAAALDRAAIAVSALGGGVRLNLVRAQEDDSGSRWELGLAVEIVKPSQADLEALAARVRATDPATIDAAGARSLVARLKANVPEAGSADPDWFFRAAGLRTVHRLAPDRLMLSHFSTEGLIVEGPGDLPVAGAKGAPFTAALLSPDDAATNAALAFALAGGATGWPSAPPWNRVSEAGLAAAIGALDLPPPDIANRLRALGLATDFAVEPFRQALARYPTRLFALLNLAPAFSAALASGQQAEWDRFGLLVEQLARSGVSSAVAMRGTGGRLVLVAGAIALPLMPSNLASRRASGFVWRALPVTDSKYTVAGSGTRALFTGGPGIGALAVVGYARVGLTDPFEYRVTAEEGTALDIGEYEFLMNALRHLTPAGVQANTWDIRRRSVAIDAAAGAAPLPVGLTRAFRPFRRPRFTGAEAAPLPPIA